MSDSISNIVGGVIGAQHSDKSSVPGHLADAVYFVNARSAIYSIIAGRDCRQAWLPSIRVNFSPN